MDSCYTTFFFSTGHLPQRGLSFPSRGPELEIEMVSDRLFRVMLKGFGIEMFTLIFFQTAAKWREGSYFTLLFQPQNIFTNDMHSVCSSIFLEPLWAY